MSTKNIVFTPPILHSKVDPEFATQLQTLHQLIFNKFQNHFEAIQGQQTQITALQAQVAALTKAK